MDFFQGDEVEELAGSDLEDMFGGLDDNNEDAIDNVLEGDEGIIIRE